MTAAINTLKPYTGSRAAIDLSAYILDPDTIFATHKARVTADGGTILNETLCKQRLNWLIDNGMYGRTAVFANPAFGVKLASNSTDVEKLYSFVGPDFVHVMQGTGTPVKLGSYNGSPVVTIKILSGSGGYLKSATPISIQTRRTYLLGGRMRDEATSDTLGIYCAYSINGLNMASFGVVGSTTQQKGWQYGTRDNVWPGATGGAVSVYRNSYGIYIPSAGLFDVDAGHIHAYESGAAVSDGVSTTGALADLSSYSQTLYLGNNILAGAVQPCLGSVMEIIILNTASAADAVLVSNLS